MMLKMFLPAALLAAGLAVPAHAAPLAPSPAAALADAAVEAVAYGCGRGFAPDGWGRCRPMYRPYGSYGPRRYGYGYGPRVYDRPGITVGVPGGRLSFY